MKDSDILILVFKLSAFEEINLVKELLHFLPNSSLILLISFLHFYIRR